MNGTSRPLFSACNHSYLFRRSLGRSFPSSKRALWPSSLRASLIEARKGGGSTRRSVKWTVRFSICLTTSVDEWISSILALFARSRLALDARERANCSTSCLNSNHIGLPQNGLWRLVNIAWECANSTSLDREVRIHFVIVLLWFVVPCELLKHFWDGACSFTELHESHLSTIVASFPGLPRFLFFGLRSV